ncbi:hypothetical protein Z945_2097 [Sulfitobacter noctilucae]|nr:hypothetical protein Z945_2097 [Sulfitobacter noctilucae]
MPFFDFTGAFRDPCADTMQVSDHSPEPRGAQPPIILTFIVRSATNYPSAATPCRLRATTGPSSVGTTRNERREPWRHSVPKVRARSIRTNSRL